jgi:type 1 glutamine amidotransferase
VSWRSNTFTANSSKGIYVTADNSSETLQFKKFGVIKVGDIPFQIVSPSKSPTGNNVCVLKGGSGFAKSLPKIVEIKAGVKATQLHFLGGVGGWAYPWGDKSGHDVPVMKVTVHYADNQTEEITVRNGREVADYNGSYDVPGSKAVPDLVRNGQVRWFSKPLGRQALVDHISLESFDNHVAPTVVAVTAELADASQSAANQTATSSTPNRKMTLTLIVGGGSSHDFDRWFNREDSMILQATGKGAVSYTDKPESILPLLRNLDALYLSNNQPLTNAELREGIVHFADAGKGLLLVHPAIWYNWKDWPEYNRGLVGGGSRSHDKYGEFEVTVVEPAHPIVAGVPKTFKITDELYRFEKDPEGTPILVLATGKEPSSGKTYPILWIVQHPKGRIVCNTLGHDGQAHQHQAYKTILQNSLLWVTKQSSSDK